MTHIALGARTHSSRRLELDPDSSFCVEENNIEKEKHNATKLIL